jgi:hypothetical protein
MVDPKLKTDDELKIRVADEPESSAAAKTTCSDMETPAQKVNDMLCQVKHSDSPAGAEQAKHSESPAGAAPKVTAGNPDDLLDIIEDPHAPEHEWISACHELQNQERHNARKQQGKKSSRRIILAILSAFLIGAAGVGTAACFHVGPFAPPAASTVDFKPYMANLQKQIKSHWHPPSRDESNVITVHFKINKHGEVSDIGFDRLSRAPEADAAALKSLIESMPAFEPLPPGSPDSVDVSFTFDYNVQKGGAGK